MYVTSCLGTARNFKATYSTCMSCRRSQKKKPEDGKKECHQAPLADVTKTVGVPHKTTGLSPSCYQMLVLAKPGTQNAPLRKHPQVLTVLRDVRISLAIITSDHARCRVRSAHHRSARRQHLIRFSLGLHGLCKLVIVKRRAILG